jgi:ABC-2 type transport system permease protein
MLGFLWSMLNPLLYLSIFVFIFSQAFNDIENYPLFVITGLIFWTFFNTASNNILVSLIDSAGIMKSINVPPIIFPLSATVSNLINLLLSLIPFFILMAFLGFRPSWSTFLLIPAILNFALFTFAFSLLLATFNVFFRDIGMFWNTINPAILYVTPIAYSNTLIPEHLRWLMLFNPLYHYMEVFRSILYYKQLPDLYFVVSTTLISIFFLTVSLYTFKKLKKGFISSL